jgi:hypothetical protein
MQSELSAAFARVSPLGNWKATIDTLAVLTDDADEGNHDAEMALVRDAVIHFTGSVPEFSQQGKPRGGRTCYRVTAAGYYATIGA